MFKVISGLGIYVGWLWSLALDGPLLEQTAPLWQQVPETLFLLFLLCHSLSCFTCGYLLKHTSLKITFLLKIGSLLTTIYTGLFLALPVYCACPQTISPQLALLAAIVAGFASAPLFMSWCVTIGTLEIVAAAKAFACSIILATFITLSAPFLPVVLQQLIFTSLPLISLYLFFRCPLPQKTPVANIDLPFNLLFPRQLLLILTLIYIAGGSMFKLIFLNANFSELLYISNLAYALICIAGAFLFAKVPVPDLYQLYRPVLPLTGLGFLLFPLVTPLVSFLFLQGGLAAFDMYTWLLVAALSRSHLRPYTVTGYGLGWITLCIFSGDLLHDLITTLFATLPRTDYVSALAGALCLVATQLYPRFPEQKQTLPAGLEKTTDEPINPAITFPQDVACPLPAPAGNKVSQPVEAADAFYQVENLNILLTPRERQVLFLLTKGRNYKTISEKLGISQNTVKFHVSHIYDKFGVYNRQELLQLLEQVAREK